VKVLRTLVLVALVCALSSGLTAARHFKFVQFDIPNSSRTNLFALNDSMVLTGTYRTDTPDGPRHGFIVGPHIFRVIDDVAYPAGTTVPVVTGDYVDSNNVTHGFTYRNGTYTPLDYPGALATFVYGVNDAGVLTLLYFATETHSCHDSRAWKFPGSRCTRRHRQLHSQREHSGCRGVLMVRQQCSIPRCLAQAFGTLREV